MRRRLAPGLAATVFLWSPLAIAGTIALLGSQLLGWIFFSISDVAALCDFRDPPVRSVGRVLDVDWTRSRVGNRPIMAYRFAHDAGGATHTLTSYSTARSLRAGTTAAVEYPAGRPDRARIAGMHRRLFGPAAALAAIIPGVAALALLAAGLALAARRVRLLRDGEIVRGRLVDDRRTSAHVNRRPVHRMGFEALSRDGRTRRVTVRSSRREAIGASPDLVLDGDRGLVLPALPGQPRVEPDGSLAPGDRRPPWVIGLLLGAGLLGWAAILAVQLP
jgi:hypothetical protein